jgi:cytosine/adenosine deaminase-related metal-dependent hydrolase/ubiquinone/menaquinone biosynthesis C-methylase UbiE
MSAMTSAANLAELQLSELQKQQFARWAAEYDRSPNPMLSLEERFLTPLLPELCGKDVVDVGCGTGRWLERIARSAPRSLTGIDVSPEMLGHAREKLGRAATLAVGDATSLPTASSSADVVLASFVASYVADLDQFVAELQRIARKGAHIYITDVHPETAVACNWKRSFRYGEQGVELTSFARPMEQVISCFERAGFRTACLLEPSFGLLELETFRAAGKLEAFYAAAGLPAIYILQLQPVSSRFSASCEAFATNRLDVRGARIALDAELSIGADIEFEQGRITSIRSSREARPEHHDEDLPLLKLDGHLLLPGLINAHDHLEFGLFPNLGRGPYANAEDWARDIQENEKATIAGHRSVAKDVRLWWGAIRNLLCGVTTVCHHNPVLPDLLHEDFPVRVITNFGWAHSLAMDTELKAKFDATGGDAPFIVHAGEGLDEKSANEVFELDRAGGLDSRTVLVHGVGLTCEGIALLNKRGGTLVLCPTSNRFLFGRTLTHEALVSVRQLILGSDSPLTAAGDLLDEVRVAHREIGIAAVDLYHMLFEGAARAFRLNDGEGTIRPDAHGDLVAVRDSGATPAETIANLTTEGIELVLVGGRVHLASDEILRRLPARLTSGLEPLQVESQLRWVRAPLARLFREAERALGCDLKIGGKRVRNVCTAWL